MTPEKKGGDQVAGKSKYTFDSKIHIYRATRRMIPAGAGRPGRRCPARPSCSWSETAINPSMLLAYSIARVFDVTIEELFDFREDE